ncbi:helix-turn-helix domain-containing protein [Fructilactobacillus fructivorans]|uniref:Helix-turn-helix domain-containing protein n=1 Tax=Fructilactobacillus fructivorans TaxID=1614 RepID=A0AAE6TYU6_9LACO|nr:helix-turn-helix transcriptional regulator [Fructilactobacillus fructivorans]QFX93150.1 helix-turn-helix domain-containing protein [Fructilactobacillus fructivorans]
MFHERLRALRTGQKITLTDLATGLNTMFPTDKEHENTASQIGNWERGIRNPSYIEVKKLAEFFGVSMDYLSGRVDHEESDLSKLFISGKQLFFNGEAINNNDRYEIFQLINGYLHGKQNRGDDHENQQESLDLHY